MFYVFSRIIMRCSANYASFRLTSEWFGFIINIMSKQFGGLCKWQQKVKAAVL